MLGKRELRSLIDEYGAALRHASNAAATLDDVSDRLRGLPADGVAGDATGLVTTAYDLLFAITKFISRLEDVRADDEKG